MKKARFVATVLVALAAAALNAPALEVVSAFPVKTE